MRDYPGLTVQQQLMAGAAAIVMVASAGPAMAQTRTFDVPAQRASRGIPAFAKQAGVQILASGETVASKRTNKVQGTFTVEQGLRMLLAGTGLVAGHAGPSGIITIQAASAPREARTRANVTAVEGQDAEGRATTPDILVIGRKDWNLNLDIARTADDAQPYVVFSREQIKRSGATSLEDFFRDNLGANNTSYNSAQVGTSQSFINLRGLGAASTLILVDGRRFAQANQGDGVFSQSSVNGIPLDAIERIEVLASSASGIYGSNAVGGVINIIMRRNFSGIDATAYYGNATRLDAPEARLNLNGSFPLEGGKTRISVSGSWQRTGALREGERNYIARGRALLVANAPTFFDTLTSPLMGATPNIISNSGSNLVFKPQYGGAALGARSTYVPVGYRGITQDGVAALIANAGKQNLDLSPTVGATYAGSGALAPLVSPTQSYNASATVRRDFNKWLSLYGEFGYSRYENSELRNPAAGTYTLPANSIDNPFTTAIRVSLPISAGNVNTTTDSTNMRALAGAIVKLPFGWQAAIDLTWNWNRYNSVQGLPGFDQATTTGMQTGTLSVLKDVNQYPVVFTYLDHARSGLMQPSRSTSRSYTFKLSGPVPLLKLWGGKPIMTLVAEQDKQTQGEYTAFTDTASNSSIGFTPRRSQRTDSLYGEVRLPIVGKDNHVPLIRELELQVAGRYDRYVGVGANSFIRCFPISGTTFAAPLPASAYTTPCPQVGDAPVFATTRNSSVNPTIALRWAVSQDITFRGSYSTGYLPPYLNSLVSMDAGSPGIFAGKTIVTVRDPQRGNELIGEDLLNLGIIRVLPARIGGNPDVEPQTSTTWSFGTILTPRFLPGLRLSADWSRIVQDNFYFQPIGVLNSNSGPAAQQAFNDFLAAYPGRFTRDTNPATFGQYGVGPITFVDATTANLSFVRSESIDFAGSYETSLGKGHLVVQAAATWFRDLTIKTTPSATPIQTAGVFSNIFVSQLGGAGGVEWKGTGSILYSTDRWSLGIKGRYVGSYWLNVDHSVAPTQGSAKIGAQAYFDVFGSFKITPRTEIRGGVNNLFDRSPPVNTMRSNFYDFFGDPRGANFYLSVNQKF